MRIRITPPEGHAAHRSFSFRPADPTWAPVELLERVRAALRDYDAHLSLWWSPMRGMNSWPVGRWRIVCWMPKQGNWDTVLYWEKPDGSYREPSVAQMIAKIQSIDGDKTGETLAQASKRIGDANAAIDAKKDRNLKDEVWEEAVKRADVAGGHVKSFDMRPREKP